LGFPGEEECPGVSQVVAIVHIGGEHRKHFVDHGFLGDGPRGLLKWGVNVEEAGDLKTVKGRGRAGWLAHQKLRQPTPSLGIASTGGFHGSDANFPPAIWGAGF
jgi:hypothetical protein